MTDMQNLMLTICFGVSLGFVASGIVFLIEDAIYQHKKKKRKKQENRDKTE